MATTFADFTGDGNATKAFSFPSIKESDVKVRVDGVLKTTSTHYNITSYTTTGGGNVVFTSGNIPSSPAKIRIYRDTDVDSAKATFQAGSSVKAGDLNNNNTQLLYRAQEEQVPNLIHSWDIADQAIETSDIKDAAVTTVKIAADNITSALIADDQINSEHYVDGSIDTQHIAADQITNALIADNQIDSEHYVDGSIDRVHLAADIVDGTKIADDSINSEHYVDASIDEQHIANSAVTSNKIADNAVTTTEILNGAVTRDKIAADAIDGTKLADNAVDSEHYTDGSIDRVHLEADIIDSTKLADNAVNSEHYVDGSIDRVHLEADIIDSTKLADDAVGAEHIQANAVTDSEIATGTLDNRYFTETELTGGALDGRYFTETESDARYFNISTGDTIKDGDSFPDNDTTIATTAAINDRIIDLVDDVGGFVPIANETSFPNANPDVNNGTGTLVSIKALSQNLTSNGSGQISISNGTVGNSTVTITGAANSTTYAATFGMIVETTTTLNTYTFHRLVPKATEVTTVAGSISNVNTVAGAISNVNAVAGNATNINTVAANNTNVTNVGSNISNVNAVHANASNINTVAGINANVTTVAGISSNVTSVAGNSSNINSAVSNASNINSAVSNASNINTVAGSISNVNTTATNIASVNTTASNIANVNNFTDRYQIASNNPSTDGGGNALAAGDLYFNTSANELKVYTGSAWQGGVTATGNFAVTTGNTFTGNNIFTAHTTHNDNVKALFGTGSDMEIFHDGTHSHIIEKGGGNLALHTNSGGEIQLAKNDSGQYENMLRAVPDGAVILAYDNSTKLETTSTGVTVTGDLFFDNPDYAGSDLHFDSSLKHLKFEDGVAAKFGTGSDLSIYHNGTNSFIDNNTGDLYIGGNFIGLMNSALNEWKIKAFDNGAVELYHDNVKKLETTSSGISVTGDITVSGTVDGVDVAALNTTVGTKLANIVEDTTPQLGGNLDTNSKAILLGDSTGTLDSTSEDVNRPVSYTHLTLPTNREV